MKHKTYLKLEPKILLFGYIFSSLPPSVFSRLRTACSQSDPDILDKRSPSICGQAGAEEHWKSQGSPGHSNLNQRKSSQNVGPLFGTNQLTFTHHNETCSKC